MLLLETLFERQIMLCDLGSVDALSPRQIHRIEHIFVSHAHIDHIFGFDRVLRVLVGREKRLHLFGPPDFADRIFHKLHGYKWNLAATYPCDLIFIVTEMGPSFATRHVTFRLKHSFEPEETGEGFCEDGLILQRPSFRFRAAPLDHRTPCLGFAIEEVVHVNIWKTELARLGLPVGPWLHDLKRAVIDNVSDDFKLMIGDGARGDSKREMEIGSLRSVYRVTPGQKIGYVTDISDTPDNRRKVVGLVERADILFIEAPFASVDVALAKERAHLTTTAAGEIARAAKVRHVEPFHFSPRYAGCEQRMLTEVAEAFAGTADTAEAKSEKQ